MSDHGQVERDGMWLASPAGVSFACRCGWRSGIRTDQKAVAERLWQHIDAAHSEPSHDAGATSLSFDPLAGDCP